MPELPEVETVATGVNERIGGDRIQSVWLSRYKEPFKTPPIEMAEALTGQRIERVHRVGKHIVFDLSGDKIHPVRTQWIVHLGMTGRLLVSAAAIPVPPHTHAILSLASSRELRFVDPRRFGRLALHPIALHPNADAKPFRGPGHEPLTISPPDFRALFRNRKLP